MPITEIGSAAGEHRAAFPLDLFWEDGMPATWPQQQSLAAAIRAHPWWRVAHSECEARIVNGAAISAHAVTSAIVHPRIRVMMPGLEHHACQKQPG